MPGSSISIMAMNRSAGFAYKLYRGLSSLVQDQQSSCSYLSLFIHKRSKTSGDSRGVKLSFEKNKSVVERRTRNYYMLVHITVYQLFEHISFSGSSIRAKRNDRREPLTRRSRNLSPRARRLSCGAFEAK